MVHAQSNNYESNALVPHHNGYYVSPNFADSGQLDSLEPADVDVFFTGMLPQNPSSDRKSILLSNRNKRHQGARIFDDCGPSGLSELESQLYTIDPGYKSR